MSEHAPQADHDDGDAAGPFARSSELFETMLAGLADPGRDIDRCPRRCLEDLELALELSARR